MKSPKFDYERAQSAPHAVQLLASAGPDARVIAGGQSLMPMLAARLAGPSLLVDIGGIQEWRGIELRGDVLRIGALVCHSDIMASDLVARHAPLMAQAVHHIAHPAIRNRGTLGGSLALADPSAEWPACVTALDASIIIFGPSGERRIAATEFFQGIYTVDLAPEEIISAVEIPVARAEDRFAFDEMARRRGDFAMAGLAIAWTGGAAGRVRLVFLGVGDRPEAVDFPAGDVLAGLSGGGIDEVVAQAMAGVDPPDDPHVSRQYRLQLARVLCLRLLRRVMEKQA